MAKKNNGSRHSDRGFLLKARRAPAHAACHSDGNILSLSNEDLPSQNSPYAFLNLLSLRQAICGKAMTVFWDRNDDAQGIFANCIDILKIRDRAK